MAKAASGSRIMVSVRRVLLLGKCFIPSLRKALPISSRPLLFCGITSKAFNFGEEVDIQYQTRLNIVKLAQIEVWSVRKVG